MEVEATSEGQKGHRPRMSKRRRDEPDEPGAKRRADPLREYEREAARIADDIMADHERAERENQARVGAKRAFFERLRERGQPPLPILASMLRSQGMDTETTRAHQPQRVPGWYDAERAPLVRAANTLFVRPDLRERGVPNHEHIGTYTGFHTGVENLNAEALVRCAPGVALFHVRCGAQNSIGHYALADPLPGMAYMCMFDSGLVMLVGPSTYAEAECFAHLITLHLARCNVPAEVFNRRELNQVTMSDFGATIDLPRMATDLPDEFSYDQKFSAGCLRPSSADTSLAALIFRRGRVVYTNIKAHEAHDLHAETHRRVMAYSTRQDDRASLAYSQLVASGRQTGSVAERAHLLGQLTMDDAARAAPIDDAVGAFDLNTFLHVADTILPRMRDDLERVEFLNAMFGTSHGAAMLAGIHAMRPSLAAAGDVPMIDE